MILINSVSANNVASGKLEIEPFSLRSVASKPTEITYVAGIDTPYIRGLDQRDPVEITISADLFDKTKASDVTAWLRGKAIIVDDDEPNYYRIGQVFGSVEVTPWADEFNRFLHYEIPFLCEPYIYSLKEYKHTWNQDDFINDEGGAVKKLFHVKGDVNSNTRYRIKLNSPINLETWLSIKVNEEEFFLKMPYNFGQYANSTIEIDTAIRQAYFTNADGVHTSINHLIERGNFAKLQFKPTISNDDTTRNSFSCRFYIKNGSKYEWLQNAEYDVEVWDNPRWL